MRFLRFILLVVLLNIIRYFVAGPVEQILVLSRLFGIMEENPHIFNTTFTTMDWTTSFLYNFMMWLVATWIFVLLHKHLTGHMVVKSLKVFGLVFLLFASISAVYMNHYLHTKAFYLYNILSSLIAFTVVAVANGLLYPILLREREEDD